MARLGSLSGRPRYVEAVEQIQEVRVSYLVFAESYIQLAFMKHLDSLYNTAQKAIFIECANGGDQVAVVQSALTFKAAQSSFDALYLVLNKEHLVEDDAQNLVRKAQRRCSSIGAVYSKCEVSLHFTMPYCMEGFLLNILSEDQPDSIEECKDEFHSLMPEAEMIDAKAYGRIFTKNVLDQSRERCPVLNALISIFEN